MGRRQYTGFDVFDAAWDRIASLYERGDEVVVSVSGGKDSTVCMELAAMVAAQYDRLPVPVVMRDEEIMAPGTFEYLRRCAERTAEFDFHWVIAGQPIINCFNRTSPYWWVFDPEVSPDRWVRSWPGGPDAAPDSEPLPGRPAYWIPELHIAAITSLERFPLKGRPGWEDWDDLTPEVRLKRARANGRDTEDARQVVLVGLRVDESSQRAMGLFSSGNWIVGGTTEQGSLKARPIYDWTTPDVWRFIAQNKLDYNRVYDTMTRAGMKGRMQRVAPPTLNPAAVPTLQILARAYPRWWDRVSARLEGMRTVSQFGLKAISPPAPDRLRGETWEQLLRKEMEKPNLPPWIAERMQAAIDNATSRHGSHSTSALPDAGGCPKCMGPLSSWKELARRSWHGDPFGTHGLGLKAIEPEFFRTGAGYWEGSPSW